MTFILLSVVESYIKAVTATVDSVSEQQQPIITVVLFAVFVWFVARSVLVSQNKGCINSMRINQ